MKSESRAKSRRAYHSPHRREQARQTRRAIQDAALSLLIQGGYVGTSIGDIAEAAGVSVKTIEAIFGTKAKLLSTLWDISIVGDDEAIPLAERAWFWEMLEEPDARRQLALHARNSCRIKGRLGALTEVMRRAAQGDPEIGALWQLIQDQYMEDQTKVAESLVAKGALRAELDIAESAEIIWMLNHPSAYYLAVVERGWPEERFKRWLADAFIRQLLR